jgi:hypothetical protein
VSLTVGNVTESVNVNTAPPALQTERADVNYEISPTQVQELPTTSTAGRNFQGLYRLIPGVPPPTENNSQAGNPGRTQAVTANGIVNTVNSTKIDGAAVGYPWLQSIVAYIPPTDSIESANIATSSFNAEQGAAGGIAANLIVKSGTNSFHGGAWEYNSIRDFNARQYFTRPTAAQPDKPKNIYNEYGANIGGPIIKDKLFFFFNYNKVSLRQFKTGNAMTVPLAAVRGGDFSGTGVTIYDPQTGNANGSGRTAFAGNVIPTARLSAASQKILALLPIPNTAGTSGNYQGGAVLAYDRSSYDAKVSYNPTDRTTFFGRYSVGRSNIVDPPALGAAIGNTWDGGQPGSAPGTIQNVGLGATHTFTPNFLIDANAGFVRINLAAQAPDYGKNVGLDTLGIPGTNGTTPFQSGTPGFLVANNSSFGNYIQSNPFQFRDMQYVANLNGTYIHGQHNFRFGGEYVHSAINHLQANNAGPRGQFTFSGGVTGNNTGVAADGPNYYRAIADLLLGMPQAIGKTVQLFQPNGPRFSVFSFYAQDTWKPSPNLTINYGLRYEYYPFANRDHTGVFRFDPATSNVLIGGRGNIPTDTGEDVGKGMVVPRFGVNYRIDAKTVIRSGGGITVDPENFRFFRDSYPALITLNNTGNINGVNNNYLPAGALTTPNAAAPNMNTIPNGTLGAGIPTVAIPDISTGVVPLPANYTTQTAPQKWRRGYIEAWNLFLDRDLFKGVVLNVGYVGTHHVRQVLGIDINAGGVGGARPLFSNASSSTGVARYTGTILNVVPTADEEYSGLQLQLSNRSSRDLQYGYSYTFSKYMNNWDADSTLGTPTFSTPAYYKKNFALSGFDRKHMNVLWTAYKMPIGHGRKYLNHGVVGAIVGGWDLNTIMTYYSGKPFQITDGLQAGNGDTAVPNQISSPTLTGTRLTANSNGNPYYFVNNGNYAHSATGTNGNVGRNTLRGPGYFNLDVGLTRNIPIYREIAVVLKAESFDVTNTPQWNNPVSDYNNSGFGQIQGVLSTSNRTIRFSGRISF